MYAEREKQVDNYKKLVTNYECIDSMRVEDINALQIKLQKSKKHIKTLGILSSILLIISSVLLVK